MKQPVERHLAAILAADMRGNGVDQGRLTDARTAGDHQHLGNESDPNSLLLTIGESQLCFLDCPRPVLPVGSTRGGNGVFRHVPVKEQATFARGARHA